jgi:hypothetical protein
MLHLAVLLVLTASTGCRGGKAPAPKAGPLVETYSVEANQSQLVAGAKEKVEITIRYQRSEQPAGRLKYKVQLSAPGDWTVSPAAWDVEHKLATGDGGVNLSRVVAIEVAPDAAPGEQEVTATITPEQGALSATTLKFRIARKGG